jgi:hypothetical protein
MKISEDEVEEKIDDDDHGKDDRKHFIKDGFKDTAEEKVKKQDEAPKNQEITKKDIDQREIVGAVMLSKEYEAGVKDHQGRKLSMHKKPGMREVMLKTNLKVWRQCERGETEGQRRAGAGRPAQHVRKAWYEGGDAQDQPQGQVRQQRERGEEEGAT